ncbi:MAG: CAP domain-containing protein [Phormidesmis sp.]
MKRTAWSSITLIALALTSSGREIGGVQRQPLSSDSQPLEGQLVVAIAADCTQLNSFFSELLTLTNQARQEHDLPPLTFSYQLGQAAQSYAEDLATQNFFSHTGKDGSTITSRIQATGYPYRSAGENLAAGQRSAHSVFQSWMISEGHRANILNDQFTEVGFGLFDSTGSSDFGLYWVQNFGKPHGSSTRAETYLPESCRTSVSSALTL